MLTLFQEIIMNEGAFKNVTLFSTSIRKLGRFSPSSQNRTT